MTLGRNYRRLWFAASISYLGDGVVLAAAPLLAASLSRDPVLVANVATFERLPWVLFTLLAGAVADRVDRRRLMAAADAVRALLLGVAALAIAQGWMNLPLLYALVFALGTAETLFDNASQAIMPMLVPRTELGSANARLYGAQIVTTQFVGPPLGSFLFAAAAAAPFAIDAGSFAVSGVIVLAMTGSFRPRRDEAAAAAPSSLRADIAEGLRWLWRHRLLRTMAISLGVFNLLWNASYALLVLFALEILGMSATGYGVLLVASAVGSLAGSLLASRIERRLGGGRTLVSIGVLSGLSMIAIAPASDPWLVGALLSVDAFGGVVWNVVTVSLRQSLIPEHLMGRVNSAYRLLGWGSIPIGAAIGGALAKGLGLRWLFAVSGASLVAAAALLFARMVQPIRAIGSETA